jgi:hypothetical protein
MQFVYGLGIAQVEAAGRFAGLQTMPEKVHAGRSVQNHYSAFQVSFIIIHQQFYLKSAISQGGYDIFKLFFGLFSLSGLSGLN